MHTSIIVRYGRRTAELFNTGTTMKTILTLVMAGCSAIVLAAAQSCSADRATPSGMAPRLVWEDATGPGTISPNGRYLVFVGGREVGLDRVSALYVRDLLAGLNRQLTTVDHAGDIGGEFVFAPDGNLVAYGWYTGVRTFLRFVTLDGSAPPVFHQSDEWCDLSPTDWSADGKQILAVGNHIGSGPVLVLLVSVADGSVHDLKTFPSEYFPSRMSLSRDGRYLVYDYPAQGDSGERDIFILGTQGGQEARLVARAADDRYPVFTPDGRGVLFFSRGAAGEPMEAWYLRCVDGRPQGSPELLRPDMGTDPSLIGFIANGSLYYYRDDAATKLFAATLDPMNGTIAVQPATVTQRPVSGTAGWSSSGQYLAYESSRPSARGPVATIVIRSLETGEEHDLAPALTDLNTRGWFPDGRFLIVTGADKAGRQGIYRVDVRTGDAAPLVYAKPGETLDRPSWFANGRSIVFIRSVSAGDRIVLHDLETGRETELYRPVAPFSIGWSLEVSTDGQHISFFLRNQESRTSSVMIMTAAGEAPRELGGRWTYPERVNDIVALTPDGRQVLFTTRDVEQPQLGQKLWRIHVDGGGPQEIPIHKELAGMARVVFHPDGKQFAFSIFSSKPSVWVMENFLPAAKTVKN